jgi:hypothetical protein
MKRIVIGTALLVLLPAGPAMAAPTPSPVAPMHTGTACASVFAHNPQTSADSHSAPPAQVNFAAVGLAFCSG